MTRNSVTLDDLDLGSCIITRTPAIYLDYSHKKSWPLGLGQDNLSPRPHSPAAYVVVFYNFIL